MVRHVVFLLSVSVWCLSIHAPEERHRMRHDAGRPVTFKETKDSTSVRPDVEEPSLRAMEELSNGIHTNQQQQQQQLQASPTETTDQAQLTSKGPASDHVSMAVAMTLMMIITIAGTAGNLLVILAIKKTKKLQTLSNAFIVNLSVCDLLFISLVLPFNGYTYLLEGWYLDARLCKFIGFLGYALTGTILMNICLIAWNRFKLVTDLAGYKDLFTARNVALMVAASWTVPALCLLPSLLELWGRFGYVAMLVTCNLLLSHDSQSFKVFLLMVRAVLPCALLAYCYCVIFRLSHQSHRKMQRCVSNTRTYEQCVQRHERHLTNTVCIIFVVFALSYFPCAVTGIIDWNWTLSKNYHMYCELTVYLGSAINPMIYGLMNPQFRDAYADLLCPARTQSDAAALPAKRRRSTAVVAVHCADAGESLDYPLLQSGSHQHTTTTTLATILTATEFNDQDMGTTSEGYSGSGGVSEGQLLHWMLDSTTSLCDQSETTAAEGVKV